MMYWNFGGMRPHLITPVPHLGILRGDIVYYDRVSADEETWQVFINPASADFRWRVLGENPEKPEEKYVILRLTLDTERGVRPDIKIDLTTVFLTSEVGFKEKAPTGEDALLRDQQYHPRDAYPREWKLTLKDGGSNGSHPGFYARRTDGTGEVKAGGQIRLSWYGAQTGKNEYVSVFLMREPSGGSVLSYGHLAKTENGSPDSPAGGVPLRIPEYIPEGNYTLAVFAEQCNGDCSTDYASDVVRIPLAVV